MSTWQLLFQNSSSPLDEWIFTPVINDARFFKISHNLSNYGNEIVGQIAQTEITPNKLLLFEQRRFNLSEAEQIIQFNKPEFFTNRVLSLLLVDLRETHPDLNIELKVEYFPFIDSLDDPVQLNRIENKLDYLIFNNESTTYTVHLENASIENYSVILDD